MNGLTKRCHTQLQDMASASWILKKYHGFLRGFKGYEEVRVPPVRSGDPEASEHLVQISEMEDWAQLAFAGYKYALYAWKH